LLFYVKAISYAIANVALLRLASCSQSKANIAPDICQLTRSYRTFTSRRLSSLERAGASWPCGVAKQAEVSFQENSFLYGVSLQVRGLDTCVGYNFNGDKQQRRRGVNSLIRTTLARAVWIKASFLRAFHQRMLQNGLHLLCPTANCLHRAQVSNVIVVAVHVDRLPSGVITTFARFVQFPMCGRSGRDARLRDFALESGPVVPLLLKELPSLCFVTEPTK
jgi:hypothetical protein